MNKKEYVSPFAVENRDIMEMHSNGKKCISEDKHGYTKYTEIDVPKNVLLACYFGGYVGIHKFMQHEIGKGILYLLTGGIFIIGWLVDCFKYTYRYFNGKTVEIYIDKKTIVHNINKAAKDIEETTNPERFFNACEIYKTNLDILERARKDGMSANGINIKYISMNTDETQTIIVNEFIDRLYQKTKERAVSVSTENGRMDQYDRFFELLRQYESKMTQSSITYYKEKKFYS